MNFTAVAKRVLEECVALKPKERALIIADSRSESNLVQAMTTMAEWMGAHVITTIVPWKKPLPHGYLSWEEPSERLWRLVAGSDVVIDYRSELVALTQAIRSSDRSRLRILYMNGNMDYQRPLILEEDLREMSKLGKRITNAVKEATEIRVTSKLGTDVMAELIQPITVTYDDSQATEPGTEDYFPGGMWSTAAKDGTMNGVTVFDASLYPTGILRDPVTVTWENGKIREINGGRQAQQWQHWLDSFNEPEIYSHSHMGGGLSKTAVTTGHDWEDLITYGAALFSGGNNIYHGGKQGGQSHFDAVLLNATIYLDNEIICKDGKYLI